VSTIKVKNEDGSWDFLQLAGEDVTGLKEDVSSVKSELAQSVYEETVTVRVPTDYPDLQSALDDYSKKRNPQGKQVKLLIEAGHALTKGLEVRHGEYRNFEIQSVDPVVFLSPTFQGVQPLPTDSDEYAFAEVENSLIVGINAGMPVLGCVIDMANTHGTGYFGYNAKGLVKEQCGVINAGKRGIYCVASHIDARGVNFSGATNEGFRAQHGAVADLMGSNFDNCCKDGIGEAAIYVSKGSLVGARELSAQNSGTNGLKVRRSKVDAEDSNFSGAMGTGINGSGIRAEGQAEISATGAIADNCKYGVYATQLSIISGGIQTKNNAVYDIAVFHGSMVMGGETTNSATSGLYPDLTTCNIKHINMPTGNGMIIAQTQANMIDYTTNANGSILKFADGTMITVTSQVTQDVTLAVDAVSAPITRPTRPATFTTILFSDLQAWGRTSVGGGGSVIGLEVYGRFYSVSDAFRVKNTGLILTSSATGYTINSIQYLEITYGRWK
jgi:hypothetical protein